MASFVKGELITADKLNQVANGKGEIHDVLKDTSKTYGPYYLPSGGYMNFVQRAYYIVGFGNYSWQFSKLENGAWTIKDEGEVDGFPWSSDDWHRYPASSYGGEGWYRLWVSQDRTGLVTWANMETYIFPWRNNCVKGDWLFHFDNYTSSGNPVGGDVLTADILNSGLVGTKPTND